MGLGLGPGLAYEAMMPGTRARVRVRARARARVRVRVRVRVGVTLFTCAP